MALEISVRHVEGMGYRVEKVAEVGSRTDARPPAEQHALSVPSQGANRNGGTSEGLAKDVGDAATTGSRLQAENHDLSVPNPKSTPQGDDLQGLVKAVGDSAEAAQKVKNLLGM